MIDQIYNIQPVQIGIGLETATASFIQFNCAYIPFETSMYYSYNMYDTGVSGSVGDTVFVGDSVLGETVLNGWGEDDQYIINAMASDVGVTLL